MTEERIGETALEDLVHECLELMEDEGPEALDRLCLSHPEAATALRARVEALRAAGLLGEDHVSEERLPAAFGEFKLLEKIGAGGMGVVHLAEQERLRRRVALKRIHPGELLFRGSRERFEREARAIASLSHPGIAALYEAREEQGVPCLVMEYVPGFSLAEVVTRFAGRSPKTLHARDLRVLLGEAAKDPDEELGFDGDWWHVCAQLVRQIAHALDHAHQRGVIHRDVKPSNVLLSAEDGRARLVDFGLAGFQGAARVTRTGARLGSLPYTPPERLSSDAVSAGPLEDVYALGVTLLELATLHTPFLVTSTEGTLKNVLEGVPRASTAGLPKDLAAICARAMERRPNARYASAAAFARDLTNFLEGVPTEARPLGSLKRAARWARRRPGMAASLVALLLALIAGPITWSVMQGRLLREERKLSAEMRGIANSLFTDVHDEIRDLHGSIEVRRRLIEIGMSYLEKVRSGTESDPGLRGMLAQGLMRAGNVYGHPGQPNLGEPARAVECYEEAAQIWADLRQEQDGDTYWAVFEARALIHRAAVERMTGNVDESAESLDQATALLDDVIVHDSANTNIPALQLQLLMDRADEMMRRGEIAAAEDLISEAGAFAREGLQADVGEDDSWAYAAGRADSLDIDRAERIGGVPAGMRVIDQQRQELLKLLEVDPQSKFARPRLIALERLASARFGKIQEWDEALLCANRALERSAGNPPAGEIWNEIALLHVYRREEQEARDALDQADVLHERGRSQSDRTTRLALARTLELRGRVEHAFSENLNEAIPYLAQAIRALSALLEEYPFDPLFLTRCSEVHVHMGHVHLARAGAATDVAVQLGGLRAAQNAFREALSSLEALREDDPMRAKKAERMKAIASDIANCTGWIAALDS